jgi:hypothetical protein
MVPTTADEAQQQPLPPLTPPQQLPPLLPHLYNTNHVGHEAILNTQQAVAVPPMFAENAATSQPPQNQQAQPTPHQQLSSSGDLDRALLDHFGSSSNHKTSLTGSKNVFFVVF